MNDFSLSRAYCNLQLPSRLVSLPTLPSQSRSPAIWHLIISITHQTRVGRPPVFVRVGAACPLPSAHPPLDPDSGPRGTAITLPSPPGRPARKPSVWSHVLTIIHPAARCGSAAAPDLHLLITAALLSVSYYDHSLSRGGTECLL